MDILDDPSFKIKYQKNKLRVKRWENDFKEKHGRRPNKDDIRAADETIKESYKMYYKLKTRALDVTLSDITFPDESRANVTANETSESEASKSCASQKSRSAIADTENVDPAEPDAAVATETPNVEGAWGAHLDQELPREKKDPRANRFLGRSAGLRLSQKSFSSSSLTKRNPRKSLSSVRLPKVKSDLGSGGGELPVGFDPGGESPLLGGLEIIEAKAKPMRASALRRLMTEGVSTIGRDLDEGWLERCTLENAPNVPAVVSREFERLAAGTGGSGFESMDPGDTANRQPVAAMSSEIKFPSAVDPEDSEDFVCDSDSEDERRRRKRIRVTAGHESSSKRRKCIEDDGETVVSREDEKPSLPAALEEVENAPVLKAGGKKKKVQTARSTGSKSSVRKTPVDDKSTELPDIPVYAIEDHPVVPRFSIPSNSHGDLVDEFARTVDTPVDEKPAPVAINSARDKLAAKVAAGRINENFVRINIKKKVFVRGKRGFNASKYRKNQWKQRKKELSSGEAGLDIADLVEANGGACFKCGEKGHFASRCRAAKGQELLPKDDRDDGDDAPKFLSLEEVERLAEKNAKLAHCSRIDKMPARPSLVSEETMERCDELFADDFDDIVPEAGELKSHKIPENLLAQLIGPVNVPIEPLYPDNTDIPEAVYEALRMFGHENFRPGQEKAVMRILSGKSTLVTLSTGSGKSLCYQLPAYLYARRSRCITLVVSPLVSLMDDQVMGIPKFLSAAALHTGQTAKVRQQIVDSIKAGELDVLLVSPEAVVAGEKSNGFGGLFGQLPPIAFACIDEAHCISQWSHNFRPSYLMLCRVLLEKLRVRTILGLTATATRATAESIVRHLAIPDGIAGVISDVPMPKNLTLTVSKDEGRDRALVELILSPRFKDCDSVIVYCTRREECARIASVLRIALQSNYQENVSKSKCSAYAEAYHAGMSASRRKIVQKAFMSGHTRIVVATVAFGMGINKADIRSVIHYNMPASFEGYVQEVGRAGRDNLPAHCHLFLSPSEDADKLELRRHVFANGVDRHTIRRLLGKVFVGCSCGRNGNGGKRCQGHEVAIPIDETVRSLDITEETVSTLLCYLELHPKRYITVLSSVYTNAKVSSYAGPKALKIAAQMSPPLAMAIALDLKRGVSHESSSMVEFPVVDVAAAIGWDSGVVKNHLKSLEWQTVDGRPSRSAITVNFDTLGLRVRAPGDLTDAELDEALEALDERVKSQEISSLRQLETIHASLEKFSTNTVKRCVELSPEVIAKSESLKEVIREYFRSDDPLSSIELPLGNTGSNEATITCDVRGLISSYRDNNFTGRAVARIFHGIQSPNYSALVWSRCRYWRSHLETDFNLICRIANREILAMR